MFGTIAPPVSYTHLDVYKRQAIALKKGCKNAAEAAEAIGIGLQAFCIPGSVAVSYTHLDVYKRQPEVYICSEDKNCYLQED